MVMTLVVGLLVLAACGDEDQREGTMVPGVGPGISVAEALDSELEGPLLVNGYLFVLEDGSVVLSDAMAESFPPQPGGASITVERIDLEPILLVTAPEDSELATVQWTEAPIQVLGVIAGGVLVVSIGSTG